MDKMLRGYSSEDAVMCMDIEMRDKDKKVVAVTTVSPEDYLWAIGCSWCVVGGYAHGSYLGKRTYLHRLVMQKQNVSVGSLDQVCVDHIDGNKLNNTRQNLRWASISENQRNKRKHKNNTSGYTGVHFTKKDQRWKAVIRDTNGTVIYLGSFKDKEEAIKKRKEAEEIYFTDFQKRVRQKTHG